jgi:hypothetical protein
VVEIATLQALRRDVRTARTERVASLVAPGGTLLVGAFAAEADVEVGPPWPLTRAGVESFAGEGMRLIALDGPVADASGGPGSRALSPLSSA